MKAEGQLKDTHWASYYKTICYESVTYKPKSLVFQSRSVYQAGGWLFIFQ